MIYFIFKDKTLLYQSRSLKQHEIEKGEVVIGEGGISTDYSYYQKEESISSGFVAIVNDLGNIEYIESPIRIERRNAKEASINKLKGLLPGLNDNDIKNLGL